MKQNIIIAIFFILPLSASAYEVVSHDVLQMNSHAIMGGGIQMDANQGGIYLMTSHSAYSSAATTGNYSFSAGTMALPVGNIIDVPYDQSYYAPNRRRATMEDDPFNSGDNAGTPGDPNPNPVGNGIRVLVSFAAIYLFCKNKCRLHKIFAEKFAQSKKK